MSTQPADNQGQPSQVVSHGPGAWAWGPPNPAWSQPSTAWSQPATVSQPLPGPVPSAQPGVLPSTNPGQPTVPGSAPSGNLTVATFAPRRRRAGPVALTVVAVTVFAALLYFGTRPDVLIPGASPSPTPTTSRPSTSLPTGGNFANSIRFESSRVAGTFTINDSFWTDSTLVAEVTVAVERGYLDYQFLAMDMASGDVTSPDLPSSPSDLLGGTIYQGEQVSGTVRFTKNRGDTQILLGEVGGRNLTMLAVKG